ncbi:sodium:solute symporter family transporter [Flavobacterium luminosum]|uniref:Sodium:solute symporter n=1 Tax=Flavobacterium luminosum TaxID=2949086 RepID=A0ABT0TPC1_9FLAO|nr:sodium:solute symporter [Flavobacterium sp. HXWNR70]MCL9809230.1 sodium:solute symporter [Flavobacterium sp. HXWNR70]
MKNSENWTLYMISILVLYALVILFFVIRGALTTKNMKDYALGNINFPAWFIGLSLAASMTSAATFIINPGFIALYGFSGIISFAIVMPIASFVSLVVFTKGFAKYGSAVQATTMAQWMGNRFNSKSYSLFFAFVALLHITFIVLINVGLTQIISKAIGVEPYYVLMGIVVFVFGYMMFGGANSMVYTNTIQAVLKFIVAVVLIGSGYDYFSDGMSGFITKLNTIDPALTKPTNESSYLFRDYYEIILSQIIIGVAIVCQPHIITKSLLLKDQRKINIFLISAIAFLIVYFSVVLVGFYARISIPDLTYKGNPLKMDEIIPTYVVTHFSVGMSMLVVVGLISAGLAALESLIQTISSTITSDLIAPLTGKESLKNSVILNRMVIIAMAVISFYLSWNQISNPKLSVAIFAQNGVYGYFAAAFVPVLFGTFIKNVRVKTVFIASVVALLTHFSVTFFELTPYMQGPVKNPGISASIAIVTSVLVAIILHKFDAASKTLQE